MPLAASSYSTSDTGGANRLVEVDTMRTYLLGLLANLYLFYFEYTYMKELMKSNMSRVKTFSFTFRYIYDLLTVNTFFEQAIDEIYPRIDIEEDNRRQCYGVVLRCSNNSELRAVPHYSIR